MTQDAINVLPISQRLSQKRSELNNSNFTALPTSREMAAIDERGIIHGLSESELIKRAAQGIYDRFRELLPQRRGHALVLVGPGNNGADALEVAVHLRGAGWTVSTINSKEFSSAQERLLRDEIFQADVIFDGLLGTGSDGEPRAQIKSIIETLNNTPRKGLVISIDIPSGINPDTGAAGLAIQADYTFAIQFIKLGMTQCPARERCGEVSIVDIGLKGNGETEYSLLNDLSVPKLPKRRLGSHKGNFGEVLVIGGNSLMPGAPVLAAEAALCAGAGLVRLCPGDDSEIRARPEIMYLGEFDDYHTRKSMKVIYSHLEEHRPTLVVGPGIGTEKETGKFLKELFKRAASLGIGGVIDADAINLIAEYRIRADFSNFVITPHPGEAARLLRCSAEQVQSDRLGSAKSLLSRFENSVVVLKGAGTIIAGSTHSDICLAGNPYMATAGSGDVLSGIIAALIAQGLTSLESAKLGVYIHALAGDSIVARRPGPLTSADLVAEISSLVGRFTAE
jgi:NAD(P)H-hydrate epimerase